MCSGSGRLAGNLALVFINRRPVEIVVIVDSIYRRLDLCFGMVG